MEPKKCSYLRKRRQKEGLSLKELGEKAGISRHALSSIEYRRISCGELMARRLGEFFKESWVKFIVKMEK